MGTSRRHANNRSNCTSSYNTASGNRTVDSPLQEKLGKKQKEEDAPRGDLIQLVFRAPKRAKEDKRKQPGTESETGLSKDKKATNRKSLPDKTRK